MTARGPSATRRGINIARAVGTAARLATRAHALLGAIGEAGVHNLKSRLLTIAFSTERKACGRSDDCRTSNAWTQMSNVRVRCSGRLSLAQRGRDTIGAKFFVQNQCPARPRVLQRTRHHQIFLDANPGTFAEGATIVKARRQR